jgi:F-type H+-transporting ATPase subunit a
MSFLLGLLDAQAAAAASEAAATHAAEAAQAPGDVVMHHVLDVPYGDLVIGGINFGPTKHLVFFVVVAALVMVLMRIVRASYTKQGLPRGLAALVETIVVYVRDEIAEKSIGHGEGRRYTPLLLSFFFFILVAALFGLVPVPTWSHGHLAVAGVTSTANLSVTLALAFVSLLAQQWAGISRHGLVKHFTQMVPPGLPIWLVPLMIPVEILGIFTKPFALMVRLFANMLAGHMVVTALLMLIPIMAGVSTLLGVAMIPVSLGLALFIDLLEILVAFIQAYLFTLLTAIFIGTYAHPSH